MQSVKNGSEITNERAVAMDLYFATKKKERRREKQKVEKYISVKVYWSFHHMMGVQIEITRLQEVITFSTTATHSLTINKQN